jgi:hypothetical protein
VTDEIKSQRAKQMLGDPLFAEICTSLRDAIFDAWQQAKTTELREELWHRLKAVDMLRSELERVAVDGDVTRWNRRLRNTQT